MDEELKKIKDMLNNGYALSLYHNNVCVGSLLNPLKAGIELQYEVSIFDEQEHEFSVKILIGYYTYTLIYFTNYEVIGLV